MQQSVEERLAACHEIISLYKDYELAEFDYKAYTKGEEAKFDSCFSSLKQFFSKSQSSEYEPFRQRFLYLSAISESNDDYVYLNSLCSALAEDIAYLLKNSPDFLLLEENNSRAIFLQRNLSGLQQYLSEKEKENFISLSSKLAEQSSRIADDKSIIFMAGSIGSMAELSKEISSSLAGLFSTAFKKYLISALKIEPLSSEVAEINKVHKLSYRISFENSLADYNEPLTLDISSFFPYGAESAKISYSSGCIKSIFFSEGSAFLELASAPFGAHSAIADFNMVVAKASFKTSILQASSEKASFEVKGKLETKLGIQRLKGMIALEDIDPSKISGLFVYSKKQEDCFLSGSLITFFLDMPYDNEEFFIYYSVNKPVISQLSLESQIIDGNKASYLYSLKLSNLLPYELKEARIFLPLSCGKESKISISDEFLANAQAKQLGTSCYFEVNLLPKESRLFSISLSLEDYSTYWKQEIVQTIEKLSASVNNEEASMLSAKLREFLSKDLSGKVPFSELSKLLEKAHSLLLEEESLESKKSSYYFAFENIKEKLESAKSNAKLLEECGFFQDSAELSRIIEDATLLIGNAAKLAESGDFSSAEKAVYSANSLLSSEKFFKSISDFLVEKWLSLKKEFDKASSGIDAESLKDEANSLDKNFSRLVSLSDFKGASDAIEKLEMLNSEAKSLAEKKKQEKCLSLSSLYSSTASMLSSSRDLLSTMHENLDSLPDGFFESLSYVPPFSLQELESYSQKLDSIEIKLSSLPYNSFDCNLLLLPQLEKLSKDTASLSSKIGKDYNQLSKDAELIYNTAVLKKSYSSANENAEELLRKAEDYLISKDFMKSIAYSKAASSALSFNQPSGMLSLGNLPYSIIPLIVVIAAIVFLKAKKGEQKKPLKVFKLGD